MQAKRLLRWVFSPQLGDVVAEYETTSDRVRSKLANSNDWCFCELCGELTEFAVALEKRARGIYKRNGAEVPLSPQICAKAENIANRFAERYEQALAGNCAENPAHVILECCGTEGFRRLKSEELRDRESLDNPGHISVEQFRLYVEGQVRMTLWVRHGDFIGAAPGRKRVKSGPTGNPILSRAGEPSKFYCRRHNQHRSLEARRAYQRDRQLIGEFHALMAQIWSEHASTLPLWDLEAHAHVRREAYRLLQTAKPRQARSAAGSIDELLMQGITNQSEIARRLGVSRQAISAAIKRRASRGE